MLIDIWVLYAIDALDDELAFRIGTANVAKFTLCAVGRKPTCGFGVAVIDFGSKLH